MCHTWATRINSGEHKRWRQLVLFADVAQGGMDMTVLGSLLEHDFFEEPFAQAGKRSHQRAGGTGNHWGPLEGTNNSALSALVAQAIGAPSPADFRRLFDAARQRWPALPPYGLSPNDVAVLKALIHNPTDVLVGQAVYKMARDFRPLLPFAFVRYDDGAIETFARETDGSSTGAKAVDTVLADGTHYIGSADNGHRLAPNVQPQTVTETPDSLMCQWQNGGPVIRVPRPRSREVYRNAWMTVREDVVRLPDGTVTELSTVHQGALDGSGYRLPTPRI